MRSKVRLPVLAVSCAAALLASMGVVGAPQNAVASAASVDGGAFEMFSDPGLQGGAWLSTILPDDATAGPPPASTVSVLDFGHTSTDPRWRINQWNNRLDLVDAEACTYQAGVLPMLPQGGVAYQNDAHRVVRADDGTLLFEVDGRPEFATPRSVEEKWPHLGVEQDFAEKPRLTDLEALKFSIDVKVNRLDNYIPYPDRNPPSQAAQVTAFFQVQNLNTASPDYGSYVWFGVPLFGNRWQLHPGYYAPDVTGDRGTGQFINTVPASEFWAGDIRDGTWHSIDEHDLLPLMLQAFSRAQTRGYLPDTLLSDLRVSSFNAQWEVIGGAFDASFQIKDFHLEADLLPGMSTPIADPPATSPQRTMDDCVFDRLPKGSPAAWAGTMAASPVMPITTGWSGTGLVDQTIRMHTRASVGGDQLRVKLSNAHGTAPVTLNKVTVAPRSTGASATRQPVTAEFGGLESVTIPAGGTITSDPVSMVTPAQTDLLVSVYALSAPGPATWHKFSWATSYAADGDHASDVTGSAFAAQPTADSHLLWLSGIDVRNTITQCTVVAFGDSLTKGGDSSWGAFNRYPDHLARQLLALAPRGEVSVLNAGIGGNRLLKDSTTHPVPPKDAGIKALLRLDRDVLDQQEPTDAIVLFGTNDIGGSQPSTSAEIIDGLIELGERLDVAGVRAYVGTIPPFGGSIYDQPGRDAVRQQVNAWIRTNETFDAVIDFDAVLRDPADPSVLRAEYSSAGKLHLNDAGYNAMAEAVTPGLFEDRCY